MNIREQWLARFAQQMGHLTVEQIQELVAQKASIENFLTQKVSASQMAQLRFLFIKFCMLQAAQQMGQVTGEQGESLLKNKMAALQRRQEAFTLTILDRRLVTPAFVQQVAEKLHAQNILKKEDGSIIGQILTNFLAASSGCPTVNLAPNKSEPAMGTIQAGANTIALGPDQETGQPATILLTPSTATSQARSPDPAAPAINGDNSLVGAKTIIEAQGASTIKETDAAPRALPHALEKTINEAPPTAPRALPHALEKTINEAPPAAQVTDIPKQFGPYQIIKELGAGGMGKVYKAYHPKLDRVVAIKVMLATGQAAEKERSRFFSEAKLTAQLKHPNIVAVHDIGTWEGKDHIVMDFIDGEPLSVLIKRGKIAPRRALEIMRDVAMAIDYAHQQGIVHRDIKPGNIMIESTTGKPIVMDFGLAKNIKLDKNLTKSGELLGTPRYMAPEQASGNVRAITPLTDVYALGAILYELITGVTVVDGSTPFVIIAKILNQDVIPPRQRNPRLAVDLETICLKALEKEPGRRYSSARMMADDIEKFMNGEALTARPVSLTYKALKKLRRHKLLVASVLVLIWAIGGMWLYENVNSEQQAAIIAWQPWWKTFKDNWQEDWKNFEQLDAGIRHISELVNGDGRDIGGGLAALSKQILCPPPLMQKWVVYDDRLWQERSKYRQVLQSRPDTLRKYRKLYEDYRRMEERVKSRHFTTLRDKDVQVFVQAYRKQFHAFWGRDPQDMQELVAGWWEKKWQLALAKACECMLLYEQQGTPEYLELARWLANYCLILNSKSDIAGQQPLPPATGKAQEDAGQLLDKLNDLVQSQYRNAMDLSMRISFNANSLQEPIVQDSARMLRNAVRMDCSFVPAYYQIARILHLAGKQEEAIVYYQKTSQRGPNFLSSYYLLTIYFDHWRELLHRARRDKTYLSQLGAQEESLYNKIQEVQTSLHSDQDTGQYRLYRLMNQFYEKLILQERKMLREYRNQLRDNFLNFFLCPPKSHRLRPEHSERYQEYYSQGIATYRELLQLLKEIPDDSSFRSQVAYLRGLIYFDLAILKEQNDGPASYLDMALEYLHSAVKLQSFFPQAHRSLAEVYYFLGDLQKAAEHYSQLFQMVAANDNSYRETPWILPGYWKYGLCLLGLGRREEARQEFENYVGKWQRWQQDHQQAPAPSHLLVHNCVFLSLLYMQDERDNDKLQALLPFFDWQKLGMREPDIETFFYALVSLKLRHTADAHRAFANLLDERGGLREMMGKFKTVRHLMRNLFEKLRAYRDPFMCNPRWRLLEPIIDKLQAEYVWATNDDAMMFFTQIGNDSTFFRQILDLAESDPELDKAFSNMMQTVCDIPLTLSAIFDFYAKMTLDVSEEYLLQAQRLPSSRTYYLKAVACCRLALKTEKNELPKHLALLRQALDNLQAAIRADPGDIGNYYAAAIICGMLATSEPAFVDSMYFYLELSWHNRGQIALLSDTPSMPDHADMLLQYIKQEPAFVPYQAQKRFAELLQKTARPLSENSWSDVGKMAQTLHQQGKKQQSEELLRAYQGVLQKLWNKAFGKK